MYIVRLDNGQIIYIRDIRFHKEDPSVRKIDEEILSEDVFNKEAEGFVFKEIIFGSSDKLLLFQIPKTLRFQQIIKIPAKKQAEQSNQPFFLSTF